MKQTKKKKTPKNKSTKQKAGFLKKQKRLPSPWQM
jgi:hypothetical protein